MTIKFASNTQRLKFNNIGMQLLVRIGHNFFEVTHASRFDYTTDELLSQTQGFIANVLTDITNTVVATFIAKELVLTNMEDKVNDMRDRAGADYTNLYFLTSDGLFQVGKMIFENPKEQDKARAEDLAIAQGNHHMSINPELALIASTETSDEKEIPKLHFLASTEDMAFKKISKVS